MKDIDKAAMQAIALAKQRGAKEVAPDDLLLGCLYALSHFGIANFGSWVFDLEKLGVDWLAPVGASGAKVAYSDAVVGIFDRAAQIARADGGDGVRVEHLLVAFATETSGLMKKLKREHKIESSAWRAAAAELAPPAPEVRVREVGGGATRDYLTPEEAAAALGIHVQTLRAYVRSGKLPALRLAGERAIRIQRADLHKVLEPLIPEQ